MKLCGLHLPNRNFEANEWPRIQGLGVQHYVDLQHFRPRWNWIKSQQPGALIHAREDVKGFLGNPQDEAEGLFSLIKEQGANVATWRRRNEPNLKEELPKATPEEWQKWLAEFGKAIKQLAPGARVYAPAVSPGPADWLTWLDATVEGAKLGGLDGLDVHAYGDPDRVRADLQAVRQRWQGRILVTEHNFGAGNSYDLAQYATDLPKVMSVCAEFNAEAVCLFIWQWNNPDMPLPTSVDVKDSPIEQAIAALPDSGPFHITEPSTDGQTGDNQAVAKNILLDKEKLGLYANWSKQRLANDEDPRDVAAFVEHLREINADWRAPHEYGLP